jgi:tetratricopeptide (TPR) repeat protein
MNTQRKALLAALLIPALFGASCTRVRAKAAFKDGNKLYKEESYRKAIELYQRAITLMPEMAEAYVYLGSSYQALYRPGKDEDPNNKQHLERAIENYNKGLEAITSTTPERLKVRAMALGALTGIYAEGPFQDFEKALHYAQELTKDSPDDPKNLFAIANLYEKFGRVTEAEETYKRVTTLNPNDAKACGALAAFYNKTYWDAQGNIFADGSKGVRRARFTDAVGTLVRCAEIEPTNPEGPFKVATFYWSAAFRDDLLTEKQKSDYVEKGLAAVEKALEIKPNYWQAIIYKGLLYRVKASLTRDAAEKSKLIDSAVSLQKYALEMKKELQASGTEVPPEAAEASK